MKTISKRLNVIFTSLLSSLLAFLGFSCSDDTPMMYGTPMGKYDIKGTVTDEEHNPVAGSKIVVTHTDKIHPIRFDSTMTNSKGEYALSGETLASHELPIYIICTPKSTDLEADTIQLTLKFNGNGPWDFGEAEATQNFILKKK